MVDVRCEARENGDEEKREAADAIRANRVILAVLQRDTEASAQALSETDGCTDCLLGVISYLAGNLAFQYADKHELDGAIAHVENVLTEHLDTLSH